MNLHRRYLLFLVVVALSSHVASAEESSSSTAADTGHAAGFSLRGLFRRLTSYLVGPPARSGPPLSRRPMSISHRRTVYHFVSTASTHKLLHFIDAAFGDEASDDLKTAANTLLNAYADLNKPLPKMQKKARRHIQRYPGGRHSIIRQRCAVVQQIMNQCKVQGLKNGVSLNDILKKLSASTAPYSSSDQTTTLQTTKPLIQTPASTETKNLRRRNVSLSSPEITKVAFVCKTCVAGIRRTNENCNDRAHTTTKADCLACCSDD